MTVAAPRRLGRDGPEVGAIGLGAMGFAGFYGDDDESVCAGPRARVASSNTRP